MSAETRSFQLIENEGALQSFFEKNRSVDWLCFDTEFVGEKRFVTRLCLIQVTSVHGSYLIDPFALRRLDPFLDLLQNPAIVKVTHAGENDYRILYEQYDVTPCNVFDTQIAAGLVGYRYPVSLRKLVEGELDRRLKKGYTVADWETRPFNPKQLRYALDDVLPLYDLWRSLEHRLRQYGRTEWAREEFLRLEETDYYAKDPNKEALDSRLMYSLNPREQFFLLRLYEWRRQLAREKNYSKEMVLPNKLLSHIVRTVPSGQDAMRNNRRIPGKIVDRYGPVFEEMYRKEPTPEERRLLDRITHEDNEDPREEILLEMLYLVIKYRCMEEEVSPNLVMPRGLLKKLRASGGLVEEVLGESWRGQFLGEHFLNWLKQFDQLEIKIIGDQINLQLRS